MLRRPLLSLLLALAIAAVFVGGLSRLFILRYETGDVYPAYSSLRADPLGTKALAAALDELPGVEVQRNFKPLPRLRPAAPVTLVYAGVSHRSYWSDEELLAFDSLVADGSRAIFTFSPVASPPAPSVDKRAEETERKAKEEKTKTEKDGENEKNKKEKKGRKPKDSKADSAKDKKPADEKKDARDKKSDDETGRETDSLIGFDVVAKRWGFTFGYLPEEKGKSYDRRAALVEPGGHLESDISWHSALDFKDLKPQWKVLYMCGTMPVVIERQFGSGSIVMVADSFLVSNEALRQERHPLFLSRLFSGPPTIVFDEEHHNLRESPGVASLIRKYRLHGLGAGILLLGILFVWKNVVRFVPAYEIPAAESDIVEGKEAGEGFVNLLRRTISRSALFETCMSEWRKAFVHNPRDLAKATEAWAQEQTRGSRDPIATYRAISRALARKG